MCYNAGKIGVMGRDSGSHGGQPFCKLCATRLESWDDTSWDDMLSR